MTGTHWRQSPTQARWQEHWDENDAFFNKAIRQAGILAWSWINNYYTASSGISISPRMRQQVKTKQSKRDEDVLWNVEGWMDQMREGKETSGQKLPAAYKITALNMMATPNIKSTQHVDLQEQKMVGKKAGGKYKAFKDMALSMSKDFVCGTEKWMWE